MKQSRTVRFVKLVPEAELPERAHSGEQYPDAGYDLFSIENIVLDPRGIMVVHTGIAMQLPSATNRWFWEAQIRSRSGMRKRGILVPTGTIDAGYRGEVVAVVYNLTAQPYEIVVGDRVAQLVFCKLPHVQIEEVQRLLPSARGDRGFGSTGA